jgi:hypothetical protein
MAEHEEYIERLDKIEKNIDWIITYLLRKDLPVIPPAYTPDKFKFPEPNIIPTLLTCSKCGINLSPTMSYSCMHSDCPTGLGGASYLKG